MVGSNPRIDLLDCPIDVLTMSQTVDRVEEIVSSRRPSQHCPVNASVIVWMHENKQLAETINQADLTSADGQVLIWASRLLRTPLPERVAGPDLMKRLIQLAATKGYRVYFLGAREHIGLRMIELVRKEHPQIHIAGYHHGYFQPDEEDKIVDRIRESRADLLFVGLGTPQKDYFIRDHLSEMKVPFCMGVGGAFDIAAGVISRAPAWLQHAGLEWAYRLQQEPGRMWRRYLRTNFLFVFLVVKSLTVLILGRSQADR